MRKERLPVCYRWLLIYLVIVFPFSIVGCSDNEEEMEGEMITISEDQLTISVGAEETSSCIKFTALSSWSAVIEETEVDNWLKLSFNQGVGGIINLDVNLKKNTTKNNRTATIRVECGNTVKRIVLIQAGSSILIMDEADIKDFDKYYKPKEFSNINMLRSDVKWSWFRSAQSEHFFVFWEEGFGDDPNAETIDPALRVDIDDLLEKAEQFYKTNIEVLKFAEVGQNLSYLDKYKMEIYLLHQTEWLATGSGYDNTIGALWINPSTCQPVGSTIAHEIGHSFQYQVSCDKILNGETDFSQVGFRYGYGNNGEGGNTFWEQCAQWQSFQDYPEELFGYHIDVWKANYHRHFNHEWMRYASYWLPYYWMQKQGVDVVGNIWTQSRYPEDPLMTYRRLYCNNDLETLYTELYDYATRMVTYDIDVVRNYVTATACTYTTKMYNADGGYYQVGYASCPGTTGFNIIPLNVPEAGTTVKADFVGLAVGSTLAKDDPGTVLDGDGNTAGKVTTYNNNGGNTAAGWRYGFVALINGVSRYAPMNKDNSGAVSYTIPTGTEKLYLVVMGTPVQYKSHVWNDNEIDDEQWPYKVKFEGTDLLGNFFIDETATPKDVTLSFDVKCNVASIDYPQGTVDLKTSQELAQAFVMKPTVLESKLAAVGKEPAEDKVVIALQQPDGTLNYTSTANNGFWCESNGNIGNWGDTAPVYVEFSGLTMTYGHRYGVSVTGQKYTLRPTLIYTKNGIQYKATIVLNMQF